MAVCFANAQALWTTYHVKIPAAKIHAAAIMRMRAAAHDMHAARSPPKIHLLEIRMQKWA